MNTLLFILFFLTLAAAVWVAFRRLWAVGMIVAGILVYLFVVIRMTHNEMLGWLYLVGALAGGLLLVTVFEEAWRLVCAPPAPEAAPAAPRDAEPAVSSESGADSGSASDTESDSDPDIDDANVDDAERPASFDVDSDS